MLPIDGHPRAPSDRSGRPGPGPGRAVAAPWRPPPVRIRGARDTGRSTASAGECAEGWLEARRPGGEPPPGRPRGARPDHPGKTAAGGRLRKGQPEIALPPVRPGIERLSRRETAVGQAKLPGTRPRQKRLPLARGAVKQNSVAGYALAPPVFGIGAVPHQCGDLLPGGFQAAELVEGGQRVVPGVRQRLDRWVAIAKHVVPARAWGAVTVGAGEDSRRRRPLPRSQTGRHPADNPEDHRQQPSPERFLERLPG